MPQYLYHYTSIEALSQILASRQLRLSRLDKVDDLSEGETEDLGWYGHYIFVTCWTNLEEESLPFWSMYTSPNSGVRIRLPIGMLASHSIERHDLENNHHVSITESPIPESRIFGHDYTIMPCKRHDWYEIVYTDDRKLLKPEIFSQDKQRISLELGKLGKHKGLHWRFQSEYRFKVVVFPIPNFTSKRGEELERTAIEASVAIINKKPLSIECLPLDLDESTFEQLEITLGPSCGVGAEIMVNSLIEKYAPKAHIKRSVLTGKVALRKP